MGLILIVDDERAIRDFLCEALTRLGGFSVELAENGEEALKYARSRKTTSDFDRSKRQQDILAAIRKQIKEGDYLNKIKDLMGIYTVLISDMETNIDILEIVTYLRKYQDYRFEIGNVLSNDNFLYSKINDNGAYILLPQTGNYKDIQMFVKELVEN